MILHRVIRLNWYEISPTDREELFKKLTFHTHDEIVQCYRYKLGEWIEIPRGARNLLPDRWFKVKDQRVTRPLNKKLKFTLQLDDTERDKRFKGQKKAVQQMNEHEQGLIVRPPGTGKTQIALAWIAQANQKTLVIVHTDDLLDQWVEYTKNAIPNAKVGVIQGSKYEIGDVTIAMIQSLRKHFDEGKQFWGQWGAVILDEAHHAAADSFEYALNMCPAFYRFGFTASPTRADGHDPYLRFVIGPVIHDQGFTSPVTIEVIPVRTQFRYRAIRSRRGWTGLVNALIDNARRNQKIAGIADREIAKGHTVLILSRRLDHLDSIAKAMRQPCEILTGNRSRNDRRRILGSFKNGESKCVLATQLADEALDVPRLDRVILTHPGKHEGRIIQQIGRALRQFPTKKNAVIYDVVDRHCPTLRKQWMERKRTYHELKIPIRLVRRYAK